MTTETLCNRNSFDPHSQCLQCHFPCFEPKILRTCEQKLSFRDGFVFEASIAKLASEKHGDFVRENRDRRHTHSHSVHPIFNCDLLCATKITWHTTDWLSREPRSKSREEDGRSIRLCRMQPLFVRTDTERNARLNFRIFSLARSAFNQSIIGSLFDAWSICRLEYLGRFREIKYLLLLLCVETCLGKNYVTINWI
jgi:hypothetical protein